MRGTLSCIAFKKFLLRPAYRLSRLFADDSLLVNHNKIINVDGALSRLRDHFDAIHFSSL